MVGSPASKALACFALEQDTKWDVQGTDHSTVTTMGRGFQGQKGLGIPGGFVSEASPLAPRFCGALLKFCSENDCEGACARLKAFRQGV